MHDAYVFSQRDPRLTVARYDLCPSLPPDADALALQAVRDDRRGLIFHYENGGNQSPLTARVTVVFSQDGLYGYRMHANSFSLQQEEELFHLMRLAGTVPGAQAILALECRYTNYFNWCLEEQSLCFDAVDPAGLRHYMLISDEDWYDVLSIQPPRVFVRRFGAGLSDGELERDCPADAIYFD